MNKTMRLIRPLAMTGVLATAGLMTPMAAQAELSGNIGIFSQYVLRGITNAAEDDSVALQGGFDWANDTGFYAGYWGSSLGYSDPGKADGFENDLYGGFAGQAGPVSYDIGAIYYYYINIDDADTFEIIGRLGVGPVTFGFNYLTDDVLWGNQGDIYWTAAFETDLPKGFSFGATLGYYTYEDSGKYIASSENDSAFRHLDLTLSHPIGNTGADMSVSYIIGGEDRDGNDQDNAVVFGVSYGFDI